MYTFQRQGNNRRVGRASREFSEGNIKAIELITRYENITEYLSKISDMEHEGDEFVHKLFSVIDQSFVTPLDREDISKLTCSLDEILDYTHGAADRLVLFKIDKPALYMLEMSKVLLSASQEVHFTNKKYEKNHGSNRTLSSYIQV